MCRSTFERSTFLERRSQPPHNTSAARHQFTCNPAHSLKSALRLHQISSHHRNQVHHPSESLEQLASHLGRITPRPFTKLKLIVGTEMFMCTTPHLQSLLQFVHTSLQNMDVKVLFDGDPIQLPPQHSALRHHWPRRRLHKQIMRWQRSLRSSTPGVPVDHISSPVSPSSRSVHRSRCICARFDLRGIIEGGQLEQSVFF